MVQNTNLIHITFINTEDDTQVSPYSPATLMTDESQDAMLRNHLRLCGGATIKRSRSTQVIPIVCHRTGTGDTEDARFPDTVQTQLESQQATHTCQAPSNRSHLAHSPTLTTTPQKKLAPASPVHGQWATQTESDPGTGIPANTTLSQQHLKQLLKGNTCPDAGFRQALAQTRLKHRIT